MIPLTRRAELHRSPATALAFAAALDHVGLEAAVIDHLDLYSCFPAAVQVQARELGIGIDPGLDRALTVSGGMTFGGGPLNNAMLQSLAAMVDVLRADPGATGLVTAVSGMLTKPAAGIWSTAEPDVAFRHVDVTEAARAATATRVLGPEGTGSATVVGATVIHERGVPARTVAIAEFPDGRRTVAVDPDPGAAASRVDEDLVGRSIAVTAPGVWA
jgi:acetyl-CoA C-acetyltransferase